MLPHMVVPSCMVVPRGDLPGDHYQPVTAQLYCKPCTSCNLALSGTNPSLCTNDASSWDTAAPLAGAQRHQVDHAVAVAEGLRPAARQRRHRRAGGGLRRGRGRAHRLQLAPLQEGHSIQSSCSRVRQQRQPSTEWSPLLQCKRAETACSWGQAQSCWSSGSCEAAWQAHMPGGQAEAIPRHTATMGAHQRGRGRGQRGHVGRRRGSGGLLSVLGRHRLVDDQLGRGQAGAVHAGHAHVQHLQRRREEAGHPAVQRCLRGRARINNCLAHKYSESHVRLHRRPAQ